MYRFRQRNRHPLHHRRGISQSRKVCSLNRTPAHVGRIIPVPICDAICLYRRQIHNASIECDASSLFHGYRRFFPVFMLLSGDAEGKGCLIKTFLLMNRFPRPGLFSNPVLGSQHHIGYRLFPYSLLRHSISVVICLHLQAISDMLLLKGR